VTKDETEGFVQDTCARQNWTLLIGKPNITYEMMLVKYGFPGPAQHNMMYNMLKGRPLRQLKIAATNGGRIGFVTGARLRESQRRMGYAQEERKDKEGVWINPIINWSALDINAYIRQHQLVRSQVKDALHLSGECFCGSFASEHEYRDLTLWYPYMANLIDRWEKLVQTVNDLKLNNIEPKYCRWGYKDRGADEQTDFFPLCQACTLREMAGD